MNNCLLIGNGINRCFDGMSWEQLLHRIAEKHFTSADTVSSASLAFEQLKCAVLSKNIRLSSDTFASDILEELDNIPQEKYSALATHFFNLDICNILTTNFDYSIERSLIKNYNYAKYTSLVSTPQERKCSSIRHTVIDGKKIFHIHGELGKKGTVCLGNVHYAENLNSIMTRILEYSEATDSFSIKDSVFSDELVSWAQFFFKDNIYIVGLGLYDCDMDLWWLISYRRQLMLEGDNRIQNKIVYYYLFEEKNQNFKDCLESMGIEVLERRVMNNDWKQAYLEIAKSISDRMESI